MVNKSEILAYNRKAWNAQVAAKNRWTVPVSPEQVAAARKGEWEIVLTPTKPVPRSWFPDFSTQTLHVLCLASGGGQQAPILAAAGAQVTVLDNSESQLAQDRKVADREGLDIRTELGDMADLSRLSNETFDFIFHPCSNCFVENIQPVWQEAYRVLKPGCDLLSGFHNPLRDMFDYELMEKGKLEVKYKIPYSDLTSISDEQKQRFIEANEPFCFGHTLEDQIGGQLKAGFHLTGFMEDSYGDKDVLSKYIDSFIATRATKPS